MAHEHVWGDDTESYPPGMSAFAVSTASEGASLTAALRRLSASFFLLGVLNNIIYVVILSAALDLVDEQSTPKGVILFANIAPSLACKIGWPFLFHPPPRYRRRVVSCSAIACLGIVGVSLSASLAPRLLGIGLASFASGLGEMTYLQLATVYGAANDDLQLAGTAVGWFSSGTGMAGLAGAALWWLLRNLGVRVGLLLCAVLPLCMTLTYVVLLPPPSFFTSAYAALPTDEDEEEPTKPDMRLTRPQKLKLALDIALPYMAPLFFVYLAEYTINQGVAPTLLYMIPDEDDVLSTVIKSLRDYYPLWQLIYQTFVFLSRSSITLFRLPPLPPSLLPVPSILQVGLLIFTALASARGFLQRMFGEDGATWITAILIAFEGLFGGTAYVQIYYRLGVRDEGEDIGEARARADLERNFKISIVGAADTLGILCASFVGAALEPTLCSAQVARGRTLCRDL